MTRSQFQSAPLTDVRGDDGKTFANISSVMFQSAPLTDVRGDRDYVFARDGLGVVSIRSPH